MPSSGHSDNNVHEALGPHTAHAAQTVNSTQSYCLFERPVGPVKWRAVRAEEFERNEILRGAIFC